LELLYFLLDSKSRLPISEFSILCLMQVATDNFVWRGESIATEVPEAKQDVIIAVGDIR